MTIPDWRAAGLACTADPDWRRRIWIGGLILMIPVVGWPLVLGYRRMFAERLLDRARPLLPRWRDVWPKALAYGAGATLVIHTYYLPLYVWLAVRTSGEDAWSEIPWAWGLLLGGVFPVFSTLWIPAWILALRLGVLGVGPTELTSIAAAFAAVTFVIPAGFLQVSRSRRTRDAFRILAALGSIAAQPLAYARAWIGSGVMSLVAHFAIPLSPWAVVWCYLAILYAFNEVPQARRAARQGWFDELSSRHWARFTVRRRGWLEEYSVVESCAWPLGRPKRGMRVWCLGALRFPLPGRPRGFGA